MSEIVRVEASPSQWTPERVELIKKQICPAGISTDELVLFIEQCKRSGLDPLLKEAFCVKRRMNAGTKDYPKWIEKHEFQPSEAGMLGRAERFPDFKGIQASAVYDKDVIEIDAGAGTVSHKYSPGKQRGALLGAWARIVREGKEATVVWLDLASYEQPGAMWAKLKNTMIEKCARVGALRKAYPAAFGGLYIREEMPPEEFQAPEKEVNVAPQPVVTGSKTAQLKQQMAAKQAALPPAKPIQIIDESTTPDAELRSGKAEVAAKLAGVVDTLTKQAKEALGADLKTQPVENEPPPPGDEDAPPDSDPSEPPPDMMLPGQHDPMAGKIRFGQHKGKLIKDMQDDSVIWWCKFIADKGDPRNEMFQRELETEYASRKKAKK